VTSPCCCGGSRRKGTPSPVQ